MNNHDLYIISNLETEALINEIEQQLRSKGFRTILTNKIIPDQIQASSFLGIWIQKDFKEHKSFTQVENCFQHLNERTLVILFLEDIDILLDLPMLLKGRPFFDFSGSLEEEIEILAQYIISNGNPILDINTLKMNLLIGDIPDQSAGWLMNLAIENDSFEALQALWEPLDKTDSLFKIVDHCSWSIGRILRGCKSKDMKEHCLTMFAESQNSEHELIVDKFAYAIGDVYLFANSPQQSELRQAVWKLIQAGTQHQSPYVQKCYQITKSRVIRESSNIDKEGIYYDYDSFHFFVDGMKIPPSLLTKKQRDLLLRLYTYDNSSSSPICTIEELLDEIWEEQDVFASVVSSTIGSLRKKLNVVSPNAGQYIVTVRKSSQSSGGYYLKKVD